MNASQPKDRVGTTTGDYGSSMNEMESREMLEDILVAEVLSLARIIKFDTTVVDESTASRDFHEEAIREVKRHRRDIIARLAAS